MGRATIILDERLLLDLLRLPKGTRVLGSSHDPMRLAAIIHVESDVLPDVEPGTEPPHLSAVFEYDPYTGNKARWPALETPATIAVREALERAAASDQEHDSVVVSDAAALVAAKHFRDGDLAGAQKLILDDLAYQRDKREAVVVPDGARVYSAEELNRIMRQRAGLEAPTYEGAPSVDLNTGKAWNLSAWTRGEPVVRLELDERTAPASVMRGHTCKGCGATASSKWKFYANVTGAWCALCNPNPENTRKAPEPTGDSDIS